MTEEQWRDAENELERLTRSGAFYQNPDPNQRNMERVDKWLKGELTDEELKEKIEII